MMDSMDSYAGGRRTIPRNLASIAFAAMAMQPKVDPPKPKTAKREDGEVDHEWIKKRKKLLAKLRGK